MSITKIQSLSTFLLFIICSTQIMSAYATSDIISQIIAPVSDDDFASPPEDGEVAQPPAVNNQFSLIKNGLLPPILGLNCLSPVFEIAGCLTGILSAVTSQKFNGITANCCRSVINPAIIDCLTQLLTILPLPIPSLPLGGPLEGLQKFCNAIPAAQTHA